MSNIKIIFEDDSLLILDKPSGITVNRADTTKNEQTVQDWVENYLKSEVLKPKSQNTNGSEFIDRAGIVHRIDKETSGILVVSKTEECFISLQAQFKNREIEKTYLALAHGALSTVEGEISVPVGRLPWNRKRFGVLAGGKEASTKYKVLEIKYLALGKKREPLSLLELSPKTGRTHQIRVHLKYINHPIFSDPLYAGRKISRQDRKFLPRVFLHAFKINLIHPKTHKSVTFESKLPQELQEFLNNLQV